MPLVDNTADVAPPVPANNNNSESDEKVSNVFFCSCECTL